VPRDAAAAFLSEVEGIDRGWYAAPVGWFDGAGNGAFAPALRCALIGEGHCLLFAGAGIVRGSEPEAEWEETEVKLLSVLRALEQSVPG
jgi:menaquinone-specific isochorismate synthase